MLYKPTIEKSKH